jgi:hypothetical protein
VQAAYRFIVDHLTKTLGALGGICMTLAAIDPAPIRAAASSFLGQQYAAKIGAALFGLVILRGWYTGSKAKDAAATLAALQAQIAPPVAVSLDEPAVTAVPKPNAG